MGNETILKALSDYIAVYMAYRNFADRTREEYQNDLEQFMEFLEKSRITKVREIGLPIVERYVADLEQKGFASLTRKRKVVTIRSFLAFLYQDHYIETNIARLIVLPFTETTIPSVLTQGECDRLRQACAGSVRDLAIIELILQSGIKLSELIRLTVDDIEIGEKGTGIMRVLGGRGKKDRMIPLNTKACLALKSYLDERNGSGSRILFVNRFGESLGERGVQKMLRKYFISAGIENASVHTLRHTFGAHHLAKGTSSETVKEVMGRKDARSMLIYQTLAKNIITSEMQKNAL
jgi:integrase/recombinase XerD